jgi:indolepyruvate ferredoxin oxidoreductase
MGGEGANWIGEAPFSTRGHVFQNLGDGTYNHSGVQAIRAALAADVNITYKILFNDAVAMTGGQHNDGDLKAPQIVRELKAMGVKHVAVVYDEKEDVDPNAFPRGTDMHERAELPVIQRKFREIEGVSAIVYIQTCAAEKRRRRKRGQFPDPDRRVFINTDVCEGCGDCGVQSNCVSIVPVETELGRKRAIDQSSCNKDFSCVNGFCPSFVTVEGAKIRKAATASVDIGHLPEPDLPAIRGTHNVVITGVGGTGVVTIGAVLAMAAHLDGKGAGMMEMAGLAQKGGAVWVHCRLAERPEDISAIRVATGECDALIGGDLVVSAGAKTLGLLKPGSAGAVVNSHEIITGAFTRNPEFRIPADRLEVSLEARLRDRLLMLDASELARVLMGDSIYSNMLVFGAAWQRGLIPVGREAILKAIELNGAAVERNSPRLRDRPLGRAPPRTRGGGAGPEGRRETEIRERKDRLPGRSSRRLPGPAAREALPQARGRHRRPAPEGGGGEGLPQAPRLQGRIRGRAPPPRHPREGRGRVRGRSQAHLPPRPAAPVAPRPGRAAQKRAFGAWIERAYPLARPDEGPARHALRPLRLHAERRMERRLIRQYERDMAEVLKDPARNLDAAVALAELPLSIRGFGPVKEANARTAAARREELLLAFPGRGRRRGGGRVAVAPTFTIAGQDSRMPLSRHKDTRERGLSPMGGKKSRGAGDQLRPFSRRRRAGAPSSARSRTRPGG